MLKIRLTRRGKKNNAFFRIVVAEHTAPIKGGFLEVLGFVNPHTKEKNFKADRIKYWIEKGAQCSDTVHNLLVSNDVISGPKRAVKLKPSSAKALAGEKKAEPEEVKPDEAKPETKEAEKPAETAEPKKEEKETEVAKSELEKKEEKAEQLKTEEPKEEKK